MQKLCVDPSHEYLLENGKPFFYLADTIWMAFSRLDLDAWRKTLHLRRTQGFTVAQVSLLPIAHDTSESDDALTPFGRKPDGAWDFFSLNPAYFDQVETMAEIACGYGIRLAIHLLWVNYIPGTWAAKRSPATQMPLEAVRPMLEAILPRLKRFYPLYAISGDICFENEAVTEYCHTAAALVKKLDPNALTTLHIAPGQEWPDSLIHDPNLDFYSFQSGHDLVHQDKPIQYAKHYLDAAVKRPIINTEPCYEGHMHSFWGGRFTARDVRRATWLSLLSGAKAGITYGAHGVWSCHRRGDHFNNAEFSGMPFDMADALRLPGAWDVSFARAMFAQYGLFAVSPSALLQEKQPTTVCAASAEGDLIAIYQPDSAPLRLAADLSGYDGVMLVLENRYFAVPSVTAGQPSTIHPHDFVSDVLYVFTRRT